MNGLIFQTLEAVRTGLQTVNPSLAVELYEGIFDDEAITRVLTRSGTVHLTFLEANPALNRVGGETILNASYGAYVATSRGNRIQTGANAIEAVASALMSMGRDPAVTMPAYTLPIAMGSIQNLYSKGVGERGVALYGMTFAVPLVIGQAIFKDDTKAYDPTRFVFQSQTGDDPAEVLDPADTERLEARLGP